MSTCNIPPPPLAQRVDAWSPRLSRVIKQRWGGGGRCSCRDLLWWLQDGLGRGWLYSSSCILYFYFNARDVTLIDSQIHVVLMCRG
jgi:hypothetical protein